jgi:uncharacterized membrane protein
MSSDFIEDMICSAPIHLLVRKYVGDSGWNAVKSNSKAAVWNYALTHMRDHTLTNIKRSVKDRVYVHVWNNIKANTHTDSQLEAAYESLEQL